MKCSGRGEHRHLVTIISGVRLARPVSFHGFLMSRRWFQNIQAIDCDVVLEASGQVLQTVQLPIVPHVGDELDLDLAGQGVEGPVYRVVRIRHHIRPRRMTMRDDLFGVYLFVEQAPDAS